MSKMQIRTGGTQKEAWVQSNHPLSSPAPSEVKDLADTNVFVAPSV